METFYLHLLSHFNVVLISPNTATCTCIFFCHLFYPELASLPLSDIYSIQSVAVARLPPLFKPISLCAGASIFSSCPSVLSHCILTQPCVNLPIMDWCMVEWFNWFRGLICAEWMDSVFYGVKSVDVDLHKCVVHLSLLGML